MDTMSDMSAPVKEQSMAPTGDHSMDMVLGVFAARPAAEAAIDELKTGGYDAKNISIVMKDSSEAKDMAASTGTNVAGGAVSGAATGAVVGAIAGLLIGVGAIAIPGIGGILIGGPIAAALGLTGAAATTATGAMTGALAGGLVGGLVGLGVPEEDAKAYEEQVKSGAILLAVPTMHDGSDKEAKAILEAHGATQVRTIHAHA